MMELRPYQKEAVQAIYDEWAHGHEKTLLVQATGTGKTICMAQIVKDKYEQEERILLLAHRGELLEQARDKIHKHTGILPGLEKAESTAYGDQVIVGSVQSLQHDRLQKYDKDYFQTILIDEAHHSVSDTYQNILKHFTQAKILGVTATADRADRRNLGQVFDSIAFEYDIKQAVHDGYLVPIKAQMIPLDLDISNVRITSGDYSAGDLGDALEPYLEQIADRMAEYCAGRKTLVFLPLIATSQKFAQMLIKRGLRAAEVNGQTENRAEILADFEADKYDILCNSMLLTEGYDCPSIDCIVCLRPTKSRSLYVQMVGRATRLCPERNKREALILDFLWHSRNHQLCRPASLVAKDEEEAEKITRKIADADGSLDLEEVKEEVVKDTIAEREESLRKQLEEQRRKKAKTIDPLQYQFALSLDELVDYQPMFPWEFLPPTEKQLKIIERMGLNADSIPNRGYASKLMDIAMKRSQAGMATPKQVKTLDKYGFKDLEAWSKGQASKMITTIANNSWRLPQWINAAEYKPS